MTPERLLQSRMMFVSIEEAMPEIESAIALTKDRDFRNRMVVRLALLDQRMAELRDKIGFADCNG
jgi:hypothetical protein